MNEMSKWEILTLECYIMPLLKCANLATPLKSPTRARIISCPIIHHQTNYK